MNWQIIHELAAERKAKFKVGATVVATLGIDDPYIKIDKGTKGIVQSVDDIGTVHIEWETGKRLAAVLEDTIELV